MSGFENLIQILIIYTDIDFHWYLSYRFNIIEY